MEPLWEILSPLSTSCSSKSKTAVSINELVLFSQKELAVDLNCAGVGLGANREFHLWDRTRIPSHIHPILCNLWDYRLLRLPAYHEYSCLRPIYIYHSCLHQAEGRKEVRRTTLIFQSLSYRISSSSRKLDRKSL